MKKRTILCLLLVCLVASLFVSCGADSTDVPEGMQLLRNSDTLGYTMFAPDGWVVCNVSDVSACHVSAYNKTSISLAEGRLSDVPVLTGGAYDLVTYFNNSTADFPYTVTQDGEANTEVKLGNASEAASFLYTFSYDGHAYKCLQILAVYAERLYIFTYTAFDEPYQNGEKTYYAHYYDSAKLVIDNLKFRAKSSAEQAPSYETDADGYALVSDKAVNGFVFYMPKDWTCDIHEGIVQIKHADGASINLTEATETGVPAREYFNRRIRDLSVLVDDIVLYVNGEAVPYTEQTDLSDEALKSFVNASEFADAEHAAVCEYSYTYGGVRYRVQQYILIGKSFLRKTGYVFTYTSPEGTYDTHTNEVQTVIQKIRFS